MSSTHFQCQVCTDEKPNEELIRVVGNSICKQCFLEGIKPSFIAALQYEFHHPVKYAGLPLDINDFASFFTPGFLAAYHTKLQEYAIPPQDRLYCGNFAGGQVCGQLLGSKTVLQTEAAISCSACSSKICMKCFENFPSNTNHACVEREAADRFEGLIRGYHYQICPKPSCKTTVQLSEACNHMKCRLCATDFCYICGEALENVEAHYYRATCPRYGQPGTGNASAEEQERQEQDRQRAREQHRQRVAEQQRQRAEEQQRQRVAEQVHFALTILDIETIFELLEQEQDFPLHAEIPNIRTLARLDNARQNLVVRDWMCAAIAVSSFGRFIRALYLHSRRLDNLFDVIDTHAMRRPLLILIHILQLALEDMYTSQIQERPRFQDMPQHISNREAILSLSAEIGEDGFGEDLQLLRQTLEMYMHFWDGDLAPLLGFVESAQTARLDEFWAFRAYE